MMLCCRTSWLIFAATVSTVVGVRKIGVVELNSLDPDEPKAMAACAKVDDVDCKYFTKKGKKYKNVPSSYTCAFMKMCKDSSGNAVGEPVKSTGDCGKKKLSAFNVCVAVRKEPFVEPDVKEVAPMEEESEMSTEVGPDSSDDEEEPMEKVSASPVEMDDVDEKVMPTEPEPKSKMAPVPQKSDIPEMKVFSDQKPMSPPSPRVDGTPLTEEEHTETAAKAATKEYLPDEDEEEDEDEDEDHIETSAKGAAKKYVADEEDEKEMEEDETPEIEPVEEEDKAAQEKERAMAACAKVSKVDCKYFKPHKHKAVPSGYKCAFMKMCKDSSGKEKCGPVKNTGDCGAKNLQASNVCIAVRWATDPYDEEEAVKPC